MFLFGLVYMEERQLFKVTVDKVIRMKEYRYITLIEEPTLKDQAAEWFHNKWGVPKEAYI